MNFSDEVRHTKTKILKTDYSLHFVDSIIRNVQPGMDAKESLGVPTAFLNKI